MIEASKNDCRTIKRICSEVENKFGVTTRRFAAQGRGLETIQPRQIAMHLIYRHTALKQDEIGVLFGGRGCSTVCLALKRVKAILLTNGQDSDFIQSIDGMLHTRNSRQP